MKWDFIGRALQQVSSFGFTIYLARILSPEDFGLVAMSMVFIVFGEALVNLGLNSSLINFDKIDVVQINTVFILNLFIGVCLALILYFIGPSLAIYFYDNVQIIPLIKWLSLIVLPNSISLVPEALLKKELKFKQLALANVIATLFAGIFASIAVYNNMGVYGLLIQYLVFYTIRMFYVSIKSSYRPRFIFSFSSIKELWIYGKPLYISHILYTIFNRIDNLVIAKYFEPVTLGYYYRAKSLSNLVVKYSSSSLNSVLFPFVSNMKGKREKVIRSSFKMINIITIISFAISAYLFVVSRELILLLYTDKWVASVKYFRYLILAAAFVPISISFENLLKGLGESKVILYLEIVRRVGLVLGLFLGVIYSLELFLLIFSINSIIGSVLSLTAFVHYFKNGGRKLLNLVLENCVIFVAALFLVLKIVSHIEYFSSIFAVFICKTVIYSSIVWLLLFIGKRSALRDIKGLAKRSL